MKYLKKYGMINEVDYFNDILKTLDEKFYYDIKDICLELEDIGIRIEIRKPGKQDLKSLKFEPSFKILHGYNFLMIKNIYLL